MRASQLFLENPCPGRATRACRTRHSEYYRCICDSGDCSGLNGRRTYFVERNQSKQFAEPFYGLVKQRNKRFGCAVTPAESSASRRDDHVNIGIGDPLRNDRTNLIDVVFDQVSIRNVVSVLVRAGRQQIAGSVVRLVSTIGDGEDGYVEHVRGSYAKMYLLYLRIES